MLVYYFTLTCFQRTAYHIHSQRHADATLSASLSNEIESKSANQSVSKTFTIAAKQVAIPAVIFQLRACIAILLASSPTKSTLVTLVDIDVAINHRYAAAKPSCERLDISAPFIILEGAVGG